MGCVNAQTYLAFIDGALLPQFYRRRHRVFLMEVHIAVNTLVTTPAGTEKPEPTDTKTPEISLVCLQ